MKLSPGKAASITSLVLLLLFPNFLVLLGYTVNESIFLGIVAALSGGLIAGWSNMEEEQKPPKVENISNSARTDENQTKSLPETTSNNQELTPEPTDDISSFDTDFPTEITNYSRLTKGIDYEEKSPEKIVEERIKKTNNLSTKNREHFKKSKKEVSTRSQRKVVSLLSWLLMKEQESSKKRRR
jgi:hypothetical protein